MTLPISADWAADDSDGAGVCERETRNMSKLVSNIKPERKHWGLGAVSEPLLGVFINVAV